MTCAELSTTCLFIYAVCVILQDCNPVVTQLRGVMFVLSARPLYVRVWTSALQRTMVSSALLLYGIVPFDCICFSFFFLRVVAKYIYYQIIFKT